MRSLQAVGARLSASGGRARLRPRPVGGGLVAVVCVLVARIAAAQAPMPTMEFDNAVRAAVEKNPTAALAATSIVRAEALLEEARATTRPTVSASITNVTLDNARGFAGGITQPQNQVTFGATASYPILAATRWASVAEARDQIDIARLEAAESNQQIAVAAAQAYLGVIAGHRQLDVDERALAAARAHLDYATKRLEGGAGSRVNELRAAQEVSSQEARLENTRLALRRSQEALGVLVVAGGPVDAGAEPALDAPSAVNEAEWMAARPDLRRESAVMQAADRVIRDNSKNWLPTGDVSFQPQLVTPNGLFQPSRTWRLAFTVTQPIFQTGLHADTAVKQVALDQAALARQATENDARSAVRLAQAAAESNDRALVSARQAADQAAEVLQITTTAFEVGATTNIEVIDAERSSRDAATAATLAEDAVRRARLDLLVALGRFPK